MLEGAQYGCTPLAPDRLAYPEWVAETCLYSDKLPPEKEAQEICNQLALWQNEGLPEPHNVDAYFWSKLEDQYRQTFHSCTLKNKLNR